MAAKPQSYTNDRGETMAMKYEYILRIDHSDIGVVYAMPVDENHFGFFTLDEHDTGIENPVTGEKLTYATYTPAILSAEELQIIKSHMNGD